MNDTAKFQGMLNVIDGDCLTALNSVGSGTVNLIFTSPPYAMQRAKSYGGIPHADYPAWFADRADEFARVLTETGSLVINIKENVVNGERSTYVMETVLELRKRGWMWVEEYCWNKKNSFPGKWPNRLRDGWERVFHFTKNKKFKMNQDAVKVPVGSWSKTRLANLSDNDKVRVQSDGNAFGKTISNWLGRDMVLPNNVLTLATECGNKGHPAAFPYGLPAWFIKLFTDAGDTVLDPFAGSGTTLQAALDLGRRAIGVELLGQYADMCRAIRAKA